jgi:tetratricopeptide (TPR) repeat protein
MNPTDRQALDGDGRLGGRSLGAAALIALLVFFAFAPAVDNTTIWDDDDYVTENELLGAPDGLWRIWFGFDLAGTDPVIVTCETPQYYPLVFTTFYIEHALWGLDPAGFHATNILFHALNAVLLALLLRRLGLAPAVAWFAAALFGVHPVTVESVAWISERKNVLSAFFYLLAFLSYLRFSDSGLRRFYFVSLGLFVCALLSKSVTATLPVILVLAEYLRGRAIGVRTIARVVPFLVIGLVSGLFTAHIEKYHVGAAGAEWGFSIVERCLIAARALCFYAWKLVAPVNLTFIYERWNIDAAALWQYVFPAAAGAALLAAFLAQRRIGRLPFFCLCFFAVSLLPALGFVDFYPQIYSFVADHFQYIASMGVLILVAAAGGAAVARVPRRARRAAAVSAAGLVLITLCFLTRSQCRIYMDQESLWRDTIAKNEHDFLGRNNLGLLYLKKSHAGRTPAERERLFDEAESLFRAAVEANPEFDKALHNLAGIYLGRGRLEEAESVCREALRLKPGSADGHNTLGEILRRLGRFEEAEQAYLEAIRLSPLFVIPSGNLSAMADELGRLDVAEEHARRVVRLKPGTATGRIRLARILVKRQEPGEAVELLREVLAADADNLSALNDLARILATNRDDSVRDGREAVRLGSRACELTGYKKAELLATLAAAYAEAGDFNRAIQFQRQLVAGAPQDLKALHREILALYESGRPLRE